MVIAKKQVKKAGFDKAYLLVFFLYILLFPLGQLIRIELGQITLHPVDVVVLIAGLVYALKNGFPNFGKLTPFLFATLFSLLFSFKLIGFLYFARLFFYVLFYFYLREIDKNTLVSGLYAGLLIFLILGFLQYIFLPDLRWLSALGWDDHYYRLVSTLLDPGFAGIILVLGALLSVYFKYIPISMLFVLGVALTYSRASYLALMVGLVLTRKRVGYLLIALLLLLIPIIPRSGGEGVNLARKFSVDLRIFNYKETIDVWKKSPVFGIGFNNICSIRGRSVKNLHSCSGSDSSILLILATTGVVGIFTFIYLLAEMGLNPFVVAIGVHSLFVNSLFYPWVMGTMAMLIALRTKFKTD